MTSPTKSGTKYTGKAAEALARVQDVSTQKNTAKKQVKSLSADQNKLFIEAVKEGVAVTDLAAASNMSRRAIYRQLSTHEEVTGNRLVNRYDKADDASDDNGDDNGDN